MGVLAGYLRVSHVGRRDPELLRSPIEQSEEIERWAVAHGHRVEILPAELDAKGSDAARPIFRQAVDGVKDGTYSGVVVAYLSRAGRDLRLMLNLWDEVEQVGGVVYSARENIDGSTSSGRLQRNLLASIAQHELEERSEGFERATRGAVERGIWQRRQTPIGYSKDPGTRGLVKNERAKEVRRAARDFLAGRTILAISDDLGMTPGGVRAMLRNRVYLGELKVRSYVNPDAHKPILDPQTFEAVQAKLDSRVRPPRSSRPVALLAGLIRCASCGHVMTRHDSKGTLTYVCPRYHSGERCPRPASISCERVDAYVEAVSLVHLAKIEAELGRGSRVEEKQAALSEGEAELSAYLQAVEAAGIGSASAAAGMRQRQEVVDKARAEVQQAMAAASSPWLKGGAAAWKDLNHAQRNALLRGLLGAVGVKPVGGGARVSVAERVRVFRSDAELALPSGRTGDAGGIVPLLWPDPHSDYVIGMLGGEDAL